MTTEFSDLLRQRTEGIAFARYAAVERRLLEGCNRLVVEDEFAGITMGRTVYEVPRWRDHLVTRLRIERARRRYRRQRAGLRRGKR